MCGERLPRETEKGIGRGLPMTNHRWYDERGKGAVLEESWASGLGKKKSFNWGELERLRRRFPTAAKGFQHYMAACRKHQGGFSLRVLQSYQA